MKARKFRLISRDVMANCVDFIARQEYDGTVEVDVKPYKKNRSTEQNALLWKWYGYIGNELGYSKDETHDILRYKFLGIMTREVCGHQIEELPSTTKLKVGEMSEYMESISRFAAEHGIRLPMDGGYE